MLVMLTLALAGCQPAGPVAWEAQQPIEAYQDAQYNAQVRVFTLAKGDLCVPARTVYGKAFIYREVMCPHHGVGWVRSTEFKVFDSASPNGTPLRHLDPD
jgi:hypothetical protein